MGLRNVAEYKVNECFRVQTSEGAKVSLAGNVSSSSRMTPSPAASEAKVQRAICSVKAVSL